MKKMSTIPITKTVLSIIIPVLNEEDAIDLFLNIVKKHVEVARTENNLLGHIEYIFIDDGSSDATYEKLCLLSEQDNCIKALKLSRNFGKDAAISAGLAYANGEAVIPMDVDLQDPPEVIPEMVRLWKKGAKIVNAVRVDRSSDSFIKRITSSAFYKTFNKLSDFQLDENVGDFRLIDRQVVDVINTFPERTRFMKGIFSWVGFRKEMVDIVRKERASGRSKWQYWALWNFAIDGFIGATTLPLRIWTYLGMGISVSALLYAVFLVFRTLVLGVDVPGYASIMVAVLSFGGLQMLALGIFGEYLGRIAIETRRRPMYIIEEKKNI